MIVRLPSKLMRCAKCGNTGIVKETKGQYENGKQEMTRNTFVLVCGCITKSGKREVMTEEKFNKRMAYLKKKAKARKLLGKEVSK